MTPFTEYIVPKYHKIIVNTNLSPKIQIHITSSSEIHFIKTGKWETLSPEKDLLATQIISILATNYSWKSNIKQNIAVNSSYPFIYRRIQKTKGNRIKFSFQYASISITTLYQVINKHLQFLSITVKPVQHFLFTTFLHVAHFEIC